MARLLADENFPLPTVGELRRLGHDILTVQELGRGGEGWTDEEVLRYAASEERALLTLNRRDFFRLHAQDSNHSGLILCSLDLDFNRQAKLIHDHLEAAAPLRACAVRITRRPG
ncbi:MAG TPA: DUF5615 family PIN-like protein [Thermoanaerobaculia bacterium]|nr:DUF5615 family PIN-like protein [Thermoanaerobaculia bacterium]